MTNQNTPSTYETACSIRKWAIAHGLIQSLPEQIEASYTGNVQPAQLSEEVESLIRQKQLVSITFNEPGRTIFIYTRRKVYKKDLKILPTSINTCGISYTQGHVDDLCLLYTSPSPRD